VCGYSETRNTISHDMALDDGDEWEAKQAAAAAKSKKKQAKSSLGRDTVGIGHPAYWEARYNDELEEMVGKIDNFDWYCPFPPVWDMIANFIDVHDNQKILLLGVGRSSAVEYLYKQGFRDITAIDVSPSIIKRMQDKYSHLSGVEFKCMDVCEMLTLQSDAYSLVIDKGCIDALFCTTNFLTSVAKALREIHRVLRPEGGIFFCVSHATPLSRVPYFRSIEWAIDIGKMVEGESLTLFTLTKTSDRALLDRKIIGAEAVVQKRASSLTSNLENKANKQSTTRSRANAGNLVVTASVEKMVEMVDESRDKDGDGEDPPERGGGEGDDAPDVLKSPSLQQAVAAAVRASMETAKIDAEAAAAQEAHLEKIRALQREADEDREDGEEEEDERD